MADASRPMPRRSPRARVLAVLTTACAASLYGVVALGLRGAMARVFFLSGQTLIDGPVVPIEIPAVDVTISAILPAEVRPEAFQMFASPQYAALPLDPVVAAYLFGYAEFVLPICLVVGFATRLAALGLLAITMLLQIYVMPGMWWAAHVYWTLLLLVLVVKGPGVFSIDAVVRAIYLRG